MSTFVAIDFETANQYRDSACAVGIAVARDGRIVESRSYLIRPPSDWFQFTHIHGLSWRDVRHAPSFGDLWPTLVPYLLGADFLAAHNAAFDRGVLNACCESYGITNSRTPFECTVRIARSQWNLRPTTLPDVCRHLDIPLKHHDAASDAQACARIVLAAQREGWRR